LGELSLPGVCYNQLKDFKVQFPWDDGAQSQHRTVVSQKQILDLNSRTCIRTQLNNDNNSKVIRFIGYTLVSWNVPNECDFLFFY